MFPMFVMKHHENLATNKIMTILNMLHYNLIFYAMYYALSNLDSFPATLLHFTPIRSRCPAP